MSKNLAQFTDAEEKAWQHAFASYVDEGMSDDRADAAAWADLQRQFPRLKVYDGAEPVVVEDRLPVHNFPDNKHEEDMEKTQQQQMIDALVQVALLQSKEISARLAEIIAYLERREHLPALGAFEMLGDSLKFLGLALATAARSKR